MDKLNKFELTDIVKEEYRKDLLTLLENITIPQISTFSSELLEEVGEKIVVEMTSKGSIESIEIQEQFLNSLKETNKLEEFILFQTLRTLNPEGMEISSFKELVKFEPSDFIKELSTIYKDNPQHLSGKDFNNKFYDGYFENVDIDKFYLKSLKHIKENPPILETPLFQNFLTSSINHELHSSPMHTKRMSKKIDKILAIEENLKKEFDKVVNIWNEPGEKQVSENNAKRIMHRIFDEFTNNNEDKNYIIYETEQLLSELKGIDKVINLDNMASYYEEFMEIKNKNNIGNKNIKNAEVIPLKIKTNDEIANIVDKFRSDSTNNVITIKNGKKK